MISHEGMRRGAHETALSIVIPVYNGAASIEVLVGRLLEDLGAKTCLEIVLINDGSPDDSAAVCRRIAKRIPASVRFLDLSRNFGEHNAVMAGLAACTGDIAVIMDDDFQNPPGEVMKLVERIQEGFDVVFSCYEKKKHHWFRNLGSAFNNVVASVMLRKPRDLYLSSFKAINRFLIDEITQYRGPFPYIDGLILRTTNNYASQLVLHDAREEGRSSYTFRKLVRLWLNMFTNFSILPLRTASIVGFAFSVLGLGSAFFVMLEKLAKPELPIGWASTLCVVLVASGVQLFALGMIGEYLGRLFLKDNGSPQYVVRRTVIDGADADGGMREDR